MARQQLTATHLAPENPQCAGRYHRTAAAARTAGCTCPAAITAWRNSTHVGRAQHRTASRWRDIDPVAVDRAVAGLLDAAALTTDERRQAVHHLAQTEHLCDREIAERLHWTGWNGPRPQQAVAQFRSRWGIPAAPRPVVNQQRARRQRERRAAA